MIHYRTIRPAICWIALFIVSIVPMSAQVLVWEENFNADTITPTTWTYDFGNGCERNLCGWGNSELEYYTSRTENARIETGNLVIETRRENFQGSAFTSARVKTEGRMHFKYGTVEARIKLPNVVNGLWPAFWTLGTIGGAWPAIGEIDMMEVGSAAALQAGLGNRRVSSASHWSNATGAHQYNVSSTDPAVDLSADYHLYKMVWTSQFIKMYLDNNLFYTFDISGAAAANLSEFHTPHFLLLNVAVGGAYTGISNAAGVTAPLPSKMYVDYIRLYQNPGDVLYLGEDHAFIDNYGILTDLTPTADALIYGTDADLFYWNNLTPIANAVPFEGNNVWAVHANAGNWFGMGVQNNYKNLSRFANGSLKFRYKSTYTGQFKIGIKTGHGESWINFPAGTTAFGLQRNGEWSQVTIPLSNFQDPSQGRNIDLYSVKNAFMFAGDAATSGADFYFDDLYYTGGVALNPAPTVSVVSPLNNAIIQNPANLVIQATAADVNGSVRQVAFYNGTTLLGVDTSSPFSYTWNNPPVGIDTLTAKATDNGGASTTSAPVVVFITTGNNTPPTVSLTSPTNNANFLTPATITISANASDVNGQIYKVDFYKDTTLLATKTTSPYTYVWTGATAGNYTLTAKATDNGGLTTTSTAVNITVANPIRPTVRLTSPINNGTFSAPATVNITADAADANGTIRHVAFYQGATLLNVDSVSPYAFSWANVPVGNYTVTAKATDNDNNETISASVQVVVSPAPCIEIAVSGDYSYEVYTLSGSVYFKFHPLSPIMGSNLAILQLRTVANSAYSGYTMTAVGNGDFTFNQAIANGVVASFYFTYAVPSGGERNSSDQPHTYIVGTVCVPGEPSVRLTAPANLTRFNVGTTINLAAEAADADGTIRQVAFYQGATLLGVDTSRPYTWSWQNAAIGTYQLTAIATDNSGLNKTSLPITIFVQAANTNGYCETAPNGDYEYRAVTANGTVTFTFHALSPIAGCNLAIVYIREGLTGIYPGYTMTATAGTFVFSKAIAANTPLSIYFTYNTPPAGERNTRDLPHAYTVGSNCLNTTGLFSPSFADAMLIYPNIATDVVTVRLADELPTPLHIFNMTGQPVMTLKISGTQAIDVSSLPSGIYLIRSETGAIGRFLKL